MAALHENPKAWDPERLAAALSGRGATGILFGSGQAEADVALVRERLLHGERLILVSDAPADQIWRALFALVPQIWKTRLYLLGQTGIFRIDAEGPSPVDLTCARSPQVPLARDFAALLAARRVFRRNGGGDPDNGRAAAARWIGSQSGTLASDVALRAADENACWFVPETASAPPVLYLHGGGLVHYDLTVFKPMLSRLAQALDAPVLALGYDKCPETPAPRVIDDLMARLTNAVCAAGIRRIMGDSIGGLLALFATVHVLPGQFRQLGMLYPVLSLGTTFASYETFGEGYLLEQSDMRWFRSLASPPLLARGFDPQALAKDSLSDLRVDLFSAGYDVLAEEAASFAACHKLSLHIFEDLPHDFALYSASIPSARIAFDTLTQTFRENGRGLH